MRVLLLAKALAPSPRAIRRAEAFRVGLIGAGHEVLTAATEGDVDLRLPSVSGRLVTAARRMKLGRAYRALTRPLLVPDDTILDLPAALAALAAKGMRGVDVVVASGPPHGLLVLGAAAAELLGARFVADLRDPWSDHPEHASRLAPARHTDLALERTTLGRAVHAFTATESMRRALAARTSTPVEALLNGFDPALFGGPAPARETRARPLIGFYGSFYGPIDPEPLVRAVAAAGAELEHAGQDHDGALRRAVDHHGIPFTSHGLWPSARAAARMREVDVLALVLPDDPRWGYVRTQKLSEYLASGRPILALVPPGEVAEELAGFGAGSAIPPSDVDAAATALRTLANRPTRPPGPASLAWDAQVARLVRVVEATNRPTV